MRSILTAATAAALFWFGAAGAQTRKSTPSKAPAKTVAKAPAKAPAKSPARKSTAGAHKPAAATVHRSTAARKSPASSSRTAASARNRRTTRRPATTWRNRQTAPSTERYKEIQGALVTRGYLSAEEANGAWGPNSISALKRFQTDQNIESNGKINSLSLIALGLGPNHGNSAAAAPPPPKPPQEPEPGR